MNENKIIYILHRWKIGHNATILVNIYKVPKPTLIVIRPKT